MITRLRRANCIKKEFEATAHDFFSPSGSQCDFHRNEIHICMESHADRVKNMSAAKKNVTWSIFLAEKFLAGDKNC